MTRTLLIALTASLIGGTASASTVDHGGFSRNLFATQAPAGFQDPRDYANNMDVAASIANQMEPAAGTSEAAHR